MRNGILGSVSLWLAGAGLALAQSTPPPRGGLWLPPDPPATVRVIHDAQLVPAAAQAPTLPAAPDALAPALPKLLTVPTAAPQAPAADKKPDAAATPDAKPDADAAKPKEGAAPEAVKVMPRPNSPAVLPPAGVPLPTAAHGPEACPPVGCEPCGPGGRIWVSAEYNLWWTRNASLPPLVTAGPPGSSAILGRPGTVTLFGGRDLDFDDFNGFSVRAGMWLNDCQTIGIEGGYFGQGGNNIGFNSGFGLPFNTVVGRPFINPFTGMEQIEQVLVPGAVTGTVGVDASSRFQGAGADGIFNLCCGCCYRLDLTGGFRYGQLNEGLGITEDLQVDPSVPAIGGTRIRIRDQFDTENRFYGGSLGARAEVRHGRFYTDVRGGAAIGTMQQIVTIRGATAFTQPTGATTVGVGGLLALPSNIGRYKRDQFSIAPEATVRVGYQVTDHLRAYVGYSLVYWTNVVRPGDQIDRTVNPTQLPLLTGPGPFTGPARPAFVFRDTDFWAQGVNFGLEFRY